MTGKELAVLRRRAGWSQAALARRIGVSRQAISYWEQRAAIDGRGAVISRIAAQLGLEYGEKLLMSRPGLGFVTLKFVGCLSRQNIQSVADAIKMRKVTLANMARRPCKAMTRAGMPCRLQSEPGRQRCRLHGGLSTGPKTAEGKKRIAAAQRLRWQRQRYRGE